MIVKFKRGNTAAAAAHTGAEGTIFIDLELGQLRLHDGILAGGVVLAGLTQTQVEDLITGALTDLEVAISAVTGLQAALDDKVSVQTLSELNLAISAVTGLQGALDGKVDNSEIGTSIATLVAGKVPVDQLPAVVAYVVEVANVAALPGVGVANVLYVTVDDDGIHRYKVDAYVRLNPVVDVPVVATEAEVLAGTEPDAFVSPATLFALLTQIGFSRDGGGVWTLDAATTP